MPTDETATITVTGEATDPRQQLRIRWASRLNKQIRLLGWYEDGARFPKRFQLELSKAGLDVSRQAIEKWLSGKSAPAPQHQALIARVLHTSADFLFSVEVSA